MLPTTLTALFPFLSFFARLYPQGQSHSFTHEPNRLQFELRHQHAVTPDAHVIFSDVLRPPRLRAGNTTTYSIATRNISTFRPPSFRAHEEARRRSIRHAQSADLPWWEEEIVGPDVEKRETLLGLAKMTNNAYVAPEDAAWYELGKGWNDVRPCLCLPFTCCVSRDAPSWLHSRGCMYLCHVSC